MALGKDLLSPKSGGVPFHPEEHKTAGQSLWWSPPVNSPLPQQETESESHSVVSNSLRLHGLHSPWDSPGQNTGVGSFFPSPGHLPNPGIKPKSPVLQADSLSTEPQEKTENMEWVAYPFSRESSWPRNQTGVACIAGRFFTNGAIREAPTWGGVNSLNYNSPLHIGIYTAKNNLTSVNPQTRAQKKWKSRNWEISDCFGNRRNFF